MAFAGAFAAALKPLKGVAEEGPCRLRLGVLSDIHVPTMDEGEHFRKALKWFDAQKVDGVVVAGDLGFAGLIKEMKCVADIWYEVFPGDRRSDGGHVEKLFVTGNHDVDGYFYHRPEFPKVKFPIDEEPAKESFVCNRERVWEELFHEKYETVKVKEVKGYKFVLFQWFAHLASDICAERWTAEPPDTPFYNAMRYEHKKLDEFFATRGAELKGAKPFFYVQHHHPADTVFSPFLYASPQGWGGHDFGRSTKYLKEFPNCIAISGHTHVTMSDERAMRGAIQRRLFSTARRRRSDSSFPSTTTASSFRSASFRTTRTLATTGSSRGRFRAASRMSTPSVRSALSCLNFQREPFSRRP